jgi:hypothetical protein
MATKRQCYWAKIDPMLSVEVFHITTRGKNILITDENGIARRL